MMYTIASGGSVQIEFGSEYFGLMSVYRLAGSGYGLYGISGYGVSSVRNNVQEIYIGSNAKVSVTYNDSKRGYILKNEETNTVVVNIILWVGSNVIFTNV